MSEPCPDRSIAPTSRRRGGFTLIEVMVTVAIVAILASVAYPSYRDHIVRGHLVDATNGLSTFRANMERHYQDNRSYADASSGGTTFVSPCRQAVAERTVGHFVIGCSAGPTATGYTLKATGSGPVAGFGFTVSERDARATTEAPNGWPTCATAWMVKKGHAC
jgi:type IV pilus assembly protein PilE